MGENSSSPALANGVLVLSCLRFGWGVAFEVCGLGGLFERACSCKSFRESCLCLRGSSARGKETGERAVPLALRAETWPRVRCCFSRCGAFFFFCRRELAAEWCRGAQWRVKRAVAGALRAKQSERGDGRCTAAVSC
eukprot:COSAG02_NODE_2391_length_8978_cov_14.980403_2_plen_137_part_00